jgi:hypothetical protein
VQAPVTAMAITTSGAGARIYDEAHEGRKYDITSQEKPSKVNLSGFPNEFPAIMA